MTPDQRAWMITAGDAESLVFTWPSPMVVGTTVRCEIRTAPGTTGAAFLTPACGISDNGVLVTAVVALTPTESRMLADHTGDLYYDVEISIGGTSPQTVRAGKIHASQDVTR